MSRVLSKGLSLSAVVVAAAAAAACDSNNGDTSATALSTVASSASTGTGSTSGAGGSGGATTGSSGATVSSGAGGHGGTATSSGSTASNASTGSNTSVGGAGGGTVASSSSSGGNTSSGAGGSASGAGGSVSTSFVEKPLTVTLALSTVVTAGGSGGGGGSLPSSSTVLTITAMDGSTPVMTDAWLYTLENGTLTALTAFQDPDSKRRYRGLLIPCTIGGAPSGLAPCDNGDLNGVMTDKVRKKVVDGEEASAIDGTVKVTLAAAPTSTIVVVVAREDQRYYGAAAIDATGQSAPVPAGAATQETHTRVTYTKDIAPLVNSMCTVCHAPGQINPDHPLNSYDAIVNNNFAYTEQIEKCTSTYPTDSSDLQACIAGITAEEYMVEPGNPANSGFTSRTVPDANKGTSPVGLLWWGSKGSRFDTHGDRRMPSTTTTPDVSTEDPNAPVYFDDNPGFQTFFDWVAQGAPQ